MASVYPSSDGRRADAILLRGLFGRDETRRDFVVNGDFTLSVVTLLIDHDSANQLLNISQ